MIRKLPPLRFLRPESVAEACRALELHGPRAAVIAGGVDLVVRMKEGTARPEVVVDLAGLPGLRGQAETADGLTIGALTPIAGIGNERIPLLADVIAGIGGMAHRTATTLGGSLLAALRCFAFNQSVDSREALGACLRTGGDVCHAAPGGVCVATHQTDLAPALLVLDASVVIEGTNGERRISLNELHRGEADRPFRLATGEILTAVRIPWPSPDRRAAYQKLRLRKSIDRPILGIAASGIPAENGTVTDLILAATGVGPAPGYIAMPGTVTTEEAAQRATAAFHPSPALRESMWWRREVVPVLVRRAITDLATNQKSVSDTHFSSAAIGRESSK